MADDKESEEAFKQCIRMQAQGLLDDPSTFAEIHGAVKDDDEDVYDPDVVGEVMTIAFNEGQKNKLKKLIEVGFKPNAFTMYVLISQNAPDYKLWKEIAEIFEYDKTAFVGIYDFDCLPPQFYIEMMHDVGIEAMETAVNIGEYRDAMVKKIINGEKNRLTLLAARRATGKIIPYVELIPVDENSH